MTTEAFEKACILGRHIAACKENLRKIKRTEEDCLSSLYVRSDIGQIYVPSRDAAQSILNMFKGMYNTEISKSQEELDAL